MMSAPPKISLLNDPKIRNIIIQTSLAVALVLFFWWISTNAIENLRQANVASGFGFLENRAGFVISQTLIEYSSDHSYGRAFFVGLLNTLLVAVIGIALATVIGFLMGVARLSPNFLLRQLATIYVEVLRNVPLLVQLLFWYKAVLVLLPGPRNGLELGAGMTLNNRGLYMPKPIFEDGSLAILIALIVAIAGAVIYGRFAKLKQRDTGAQSPVILVALGLIIGLPLIALILTGFPVSFDIPALAGFNMRGGFVMLPELIALLLGLVLYTGAFIAEVVRAGILAVSKGQTEASYALGLRPGITMRLVIIPQAMRVIIPPLTNQYLNLTKNSSLAVAIGYPDLVAVFGGTVLNQTGQAVEVILMTMGVYLTFSLTTSMVMNWFNRKMALVER